jgi:hypothetical protein
VIAHVSPYPLGRLHPALLAALLLLTSCVTEPGPDFGEDPHLTCPTTMLLIAGGDFLLGEGEDAEFAPLEPGAVIYESNFGISSFCVDPLPFPGRAGAPWPSFGLNAALAEDLDSRLAAFGRRLCTISELLLASAGPDNWRYPYDPEDWSEGLCDPDDLTPQPLGSYEDCTSPLGVSDFQVRSTWGWLDPEMKAHLNSYDAPVTRPGEDPLPPESFEYAVQGGTSRAETFYSPTNFGIHSHPQDAVYLDDGARVCADPAQDWPDEGGYEEWLAPALDGEDLFSTPDSR